MELSFKKSFLLSESIHGSLCVLALIPRQVMYSCGLILSLVLISFFFVFRYDNEFQTKENEN